MDDENSTNGQMLIGIIHSHSDRVKKRTAACGATVCCHCGLDVARDQTPFAFHGSLVLKTPPHARAKNRTGSKNPWARHEQRKSDLLKKLAEAEEIHDFYTTLYRQYSINLLKLVIYARLLVTNERITAYLRDSHPDILATFQETVANAEGQVAA